LPAPARDPKGGRAPGYLLAVGTIEHRKNYRRLLAAYQMVRSRLPGAPPLVVVGRVGWDCRAEVEILRTSPGVEYLEHVSDLELAGLYANAAALLFPSLYEGFGLPLLDAMNRGVPALIGRTGALPELAAGAALEVDAEDLESIAGGIHRLVENAELRLELARLGRERASGFGWDRAGAEVVALLRQVATEAGGQQ
jgi:glycosyltransferase involved in cell wall biosynthesis